MSKYEKAQRQSIDALTVRNQQMQQELQDMRQRLSSVYAAAMAGIDYVAQYNGNSREREARSSVNRAMWPNAKHLD